MKKILVTGGAGFIGSHLCSKLLEMEHRVICMDNLYSGAYANIRGMRDHPNFHFIHQDINDPLSEALAVDEIYNLACPASPVHYQRDPVFTLRTCFTGSYNMLELARNSEARILQASTSEVYGDPKVHPQGEGYWGNVNPIGPRACYDEGKRCAEALFFDYHRHYDVDIRVVRIFNTYGPQMSKEDGRVVSNFIVQALNGEDLTIYGDGSQTRSFCYVDDMIEGLIKMMENDAGLTGPINLGNPEEITVLELAQRIIEITRSKSKMVFKPLPQDDPVRRRPNIRQAVEKLKWKPRVSIDEGLSGTVDFFMRF